MGGGCGCVHDSGGKEGSEGGRVSLAVPVHNIHQVSTECGGDVGEIVW